MTQIVFIGLAAAFASATLFASVASGSLLSIPLFYLSPLPILIAGLGWSHVAALIAAIGAATGLALTLGGFYFLAFLIGIGLPAWWLGYLVLLARPSDDGATLEWYPIGRAVLWAAILAAGSVSAGIISIGPDEESFRTALSQTLERIAQVQRPSPAGEPLADTTRAVDLLVLVLPAIAAALATLTNVFALWLAGRIVRVSGRLRRPWPDLPAMTFPPRALIALAGASVASFLPGLVGILGMVLTSSLLMAYAFLGLAVLHVVTRPLAGRGFILGGFYGAIAILGWPIAAAMMLGIADAAFDLRNRARRPPSSPSTSI